MLIRGGIEKVLIMSSKGFASKGFVNRAKSGTRAMPAHWRQAAAKARLTKGERPPKVSPPSQDRPARKHDAGEKPRDDRRPDLKARATEGKAP
jgi:hypothetical protein